ncbi:hypothetical protein [Oryzicola mucosus]|uniref:hypothetical protein n=1 Tax=Oryzicola mucosus TaxID=2767425 RepID=UPI001E5E0369|nr:hypothetical protein [Oryzicola mucosus]
MDGFPIERWPVSLNKAFTSASLHAGRSQKTWLRSSIPHAAWGKINERCRCCDHRRRFRWIGGGKTVRQADFTFKLLEAMDRIGGALAGPVIHTCGGARLSGQAVARDAIKELAA